MSGHVESTYSVKTGAWSSPSFVQEPYLRVHGLAPGLNYGQQAYEGLKAHRAPDSEINIFRLPVHAARLSHSASYVSIPAIPDEHFNACVRMAVARNAEFVPPHESEALLYIRPIVFGSSGHISLTAPEQFTFAVFVSPGTAYHGVKPLDACVLEDFDRAAPRGTGSAKVGGNYAPVIRWTDKARSEGFAVTLHLDAETRTMIDEFSTSGFLGIKKGDDGSVTVVVPDSKNVIQSVTSDSCCQIASRMGWKVEKRPVSSYLRGIKKVLTIGRFHGPSSPHSLKWWQLVRPLHFCRSSQSHAIRQTRRLNTVLKLGNALSSSAPP